MLTPRLVLIGAPGAGKSTVAAALAQRWDAPCVDVDSTIEQAVGMSIGDIFARDGEQRFRELERHAVLAALDVPGGVIAATSGCVLDAAVRSALLPLPVCWLQVDASHASRRHGLSALAPAYFVGMRASLVQQIADRSPCYAEVATFSINTNTRTLDEVIDACVTAADGRSV